MKDKFRFFLILALLSMIVDAQPKAFPGAEGYGAKATGWRSDTLQVVHVTNLDNDGPGSLRHALENQNTGPSGPRIVVFDTAGYIDLTHRIRVCKPNVYVAGQTAPGDGVCLRLDSGITFPTLGHHNSNRDLMLIETNDVVIRHLKFRPGRGPGNAVINSIYPDRVGCLSLGSGASSVMIDHCSFSWSPDVNIILYTNSTTEPLSNITFQWCQITEGLYRNKHPKGGRAKSFLVAGEQNSLYPDSISFHHNLIANNDRNPLIGRQGRYDLVNNVMYMFSPNPPVKLRDLYGGPIRANVIANHFERTGRAESTELYAVDAQHMPLGTATGGLEVFVSGNTSNLPIPTMDPASPHRVVSMHEMAYTTITDARVSRDLVFQYSGDVLPGRARDTVDRRIVQGIRDHTLGNMNCVEDGELIHHEGEVENLTTTSLMLDLDYHWVQYPDRINDFQDIFVDYLIELIDSTGSTIAGSRRTISQYDDHPDDGAEPDPITNPNTATIAGAPWDSVTIGAAQRYRILCDCATSNAGGWPDYVGGAPVADNDADGIPNAFEMVLGTDPDSADHTGDSDADGVLNIEEYLNSLVTNMGNKLAASDGLKMVRLQGRQNGQLSDLLFSTHEITKREYSSVTGIGPENGTELPVTELTLFDAILFCNELSLKEGLRPVYFWDGSPQYNNASLPLNCTDLDNLQADTTQNGYRLPYEEEWEWAYRGGCSSSEYYWGCSEAFPEDPDIIEKYAWFDLHSPFNKPEPVGLKEPNGYGLYDMAGNAAEYVWYLVDGAAKTKGGSSSTDKDWKLGVYVCAYPAAESTSEQIGFRIVRKAPCMSAVRAYQLLD